MVPVLFHVFGLPVGSFGVMMSLGFFASCALMVVRMREEGLDSQHWGTVLLLSVIGGAGGAKLYFAADTWLREGGELLPLLHPRAGLTWFGGLLGGTLGVWLACRIHELSLRVMGNCMVVGVAVGQALGRIGCFLAGDDYGTVTDLPWGVAFPRGAPPTLDPVHPTQLYECAWLMIVAGLLWRRRHRSPFLWGEYLVLAGLGRAVVEVWRLNPVVAWGLTAAQWIGAAAILAGAASWLFYRGRPIESPRPHPASSRQANTRSMNA